MDEKSVVPTVRAITIDERDGYCYHEVASFWREWFFGIPTSIVSVSSVNVVTFLRQLALKIYVNDMDYSYKREPFFLHIKIVFNE